jgi:phosphatidylinositol alpha-1,6-mannosyltransferase
MNAVTTSGKIELEFDSEVGTDSYGSDSPVDATSVSAGHWTLITPFFWPQLGGVQQYLAMMCRALGPEHVTVIGPKLRTAHLQSNDTSLSQFRVRRPFADRLRFVHTAVVSFSEARKRDGGVIIGVARPSAISAVAFRQLFGIPYVVCCHGKELVSESLLRKWTNRLLLAHADRVIANSTFTAELAVHSGAHPSTIDILRPALSTMVSCKDASNRCTALRDEYGLHNRRVILTVGRLVARKGHDLVLRSLKTLVDEGRHIQYVMVGDGPERARLEQIADDLGVRHAVLFAGRVSDEDMAAWYCLSDIFVMVSRSDTRDIEGFGIVYLEAAAAGKPVIAGRGGGVGDAILDGVSGILIDPTSESDLTTALRTQLDDRVSAMSMGEAGRRWVTSELSEPRFASQLRFVLQRVRAGRATEWGKP